MEASTAGSPINTPHPDDLAADDFFGGAETEEAPVEAIEEEVAQATEAPVAQETPAAAQETPAAAQETPAAVQETPAAATEDDGEDATKAKSGVPEREYIVFQSIPLTVQVLNTLLERLTAAGGDASPIVVYKELERTDARNVKGAVGKVYMKNKATLGDRCSLACVPSKSFQMKKVAPKERPAEVVLDIT